MSEEGSPLGSQSMTNPTRAGPRFSCKIHAKKRGSLLRPSLWQSIPLPIAISRRSAISSPPRTLGVGSHPFYSLNAASSPHRPLPAPPPCPIPGASQGLLR